MNWLELAGALLGLVNIVLLVRRSVWNFPFAMAMVSLMGLTLYEQKLYAETGLQVFFFVVNAWGWWLWSRAKETAVAAVPVGWMSPQSRLVWAGATAALSLSLGWVLHRFTDAALPFADSAVTGASIAAQILLGLRRVENWLLWIVIDVASIALFINRGLYLFAALYFAFLLLSAQGYREWKQAAA